MRHHLSTRILLGLVLGAAAGSLANATFGGSPALEAFVRHIAEPVGKVFLRLLFMLVIPLVTSGLALGVIGLGDLRSLARIGIKTLVYTIVVSTIAVVIGVTLVNVLRPGSGLSPELRARLIESGAGGVSPAPTPAPAGAARPVESPGAGTALLVNIVPDNIVKAMAGGDMLAVMFFSLVFGIGLATTRSPAAERLRQVIEGVYDVTMRLIGIVIGFAPIGVAALLFVLTSRLGAGVLRELGAYVLVVLLGLVIHQFVVYSLAVSALGRMSPVRFFRDIRLAMLTAFSTASSNATLPTSIQVAEQNLRLPTHIARFVLTIGSTANQNGTALFEGVTVLFLAQFYGITLDLGQQLLVVLVCILGGIGTAGVPAGSIPVVILILGLVGVPAEGIGMILGVDRILDMCRTTLNVTGDLAAAVVVARSEGADPGRATT
jgi:DAACS family dicarboxylate/amino acid:cation (Na+ or H+) symporter